MVPDISFEFLLTKYSFFSSQDNMRNTQHPFVSMLFDDHPRTKEIGALLSGIT